jgi:hypothetical protein
MAGGLCMANKHCVYHPFSEVGNLEVQFKFSRWHPLTEEFVEQDLDNRAISG